MTGKARTSGPDFRSAPRARGGWKMRSMQAVLVVPFFGVLGLALWFQFSGRMRLALLLLLCVAFLGLFRLWWSGRLRSVWVAFIGLLLVSGAWWSTIQPSNDRIWAVDVAHGVTADVMGNVVTLNHVRNFNWRTTTDFVPRWETREYALDQLSSVDLLTSVWGNPAIAHVLVSFGFEDGQHVVFSAEIRREKGEEYSAIAGFFRRYELVLIAADERDIVRLRTDVRKESVSLFPLRVKAETRRQMFLEYLALADALETGPEWYNTATTNCTTVVWQLARALAPGIPFDWRVLLSGYFPQYLYDLGVISPDLPLVETLSRAVRQPVGAAGPDGAAFSRRLRAGLEP